MSEIISAYSVKLINSLLLTVVFLGSYLFAKFFTTKRIKIRKTRSQYLIRLRYIFFILFMVFFVKIWVEGFLQILALVGFLSAALTLTQKDNLMNLVGWLIINWRGLFSEEDYIKISNFGGYVKSIGFLYFTLQEASNEFPESITGRIIKIPNGMVSKNPVMNFSHEKLIECTVNFVFKPKGTFDEIENLAALVKEEILTHLKATTTSKERIDFAPKYLIKIRYEKPAGYELVILFYCKYHDKTQLQYKINRFITNFTKAHAELILAFD